jgi:hypothetical protein
MASLWFNMYESDVPSYMRHAPEIEVEGTTLAMKWIQQNKTEPPKWMRHSSEIEKRGYTMATTWIQYVKSEPPGWMIYSPGLLLGGYTMAMKYIIVLKMEPPPSLKHEPHILSKDELSLKAYWQLYISTALPEWMNFKPYMKGVIGCSHRGDKFLNPSNELICRECDGNTGSNTNNTNNNSNNNTNNNTNNITNNNSNNNTSSVKTFCYDLCPICREDFEKGVEISMFRKCKHVFCEGCLEEWLASHPVKCPCCNKE